MRMYSHDGIRDALTQLAAPPLLYEELRREIARASRGNEEISLVRFVLAPLDLENSEERDSSTSSYQETIVRFAHSLSRLSRDEDVCARIGEREFICLLHGRADAVSRYVARIVSAWSEESVPRTGPTDGVEWRLDVASLGSQPGENALELLNRLDLETLTSYE